MNFYKCKFKGRFDRPYLPSCRYSGRTLAHIAVGIDGLRRISYPAALWESRSRASQAHRQGSGPTLC